jgi:hypothetical protein
MNNEKQTQPFEQKEIRVRFKRDVDRYPHAFIKAGELGTYIGHRMGEDAVRLDRHDENLNEWQNCVMWYDESIGFNGHVWDDVEEIDKPAIAHCTLCDREMNPAEAMLSDVCGICTRENHAKATS